MGGVTFELWTSDRKSRLTSSEDPAVYPTQGLSPLPSPATREIIKVKSQHSFKWGFAGSCMEKQRLNV